MKDILCAQLDIMTVSCQVHTIIQHDNFKLEILEQ